MIPRRILRAFVIVVVVAIVGISAPAARAADGDAGPITGENAPEVVERAPMT
nr:hypothetical protein [Planctomycetota bacterium]